MTEGEFIVGVLHNRNGNLGYGTCSKYPAHGVSEIRDGEDL